MTKFKLWHGMLFSSLLHIAVLGMGFWLLWYAAKQPAEATEMLSLDIIGIQSNQQIEAQKAVLPPPKKEPPKVVKSEQVQKISQVRVKAEKKKKPPTPPQPVTSPQPPVQEQQEQQEQQKPQEPQEQQSLSNQISELQLLQKYISNVTKLIQKNLIYPAQAKVLEQKGVVKVQFNIQADGSIATGSLRIANSSGYSELDQNALLAVQKSAPLPLPPRSMQVKIDVVFKAED